MNDRFKFRVWDKQDGCYAYSNNSDVDMLYIETDGELTYGVYNNDYEDMNYIPESEVIIEQCTGLKDKNGKLIYEGDIVIKSDVSAIGYNRTRVCKAHWHNDWLSWAITTQYGDTYELSEFEPQQYEIIGNIHENADLLENEE